MSISKRPPDEIEDSGSAGAREVLQFLLGRHSVGPKHLAEPGPDAGQLLAAARAALRAPDHRHMTPFRFAVVPSQRRAELARLFEDAARRHGHPDADIAAEGRRAWNGPVLVAMIARITPGQPEVPEHEQWISAGGALMNFLNALHLMGYGAKMLSGRKAGEPAIVEAFCGPGETLVGWIVTGTPTAAARARHDDDPAQVIGEW